MARRASFYPTGTINESPMTLRTLDHADSRTAAAKRSSTGSPCSRRYRFVSWQSRKKRSGIVADEV